MLLTHRNRSCSCCSVNCPKIYNNCYQLRSLETSESRSCRILDDLSKKLKLFLQMTLIFSQTVGFIRASTDINQAVSKNHSFQSVQSPNFYSQVPKNHRMNTNEIPEQDNKFEEQLEGDLSRTYFNTYKPSDSIEERDITNHLFGQSSSVLPSTNEKQDHSKKRQLVNSLFPQMINDRSSKKRSNQQVSKWSIEFNEEPHHSVFHSERVNSLETTTSPYFSTINRYTNDSSSPILSSLAVHFDDEYDHQRSQSQPLATVATPRRSSQDSEPDTQQMSLKQAQQALEENLALQDRLVELLNKAKSSSATQASNNTFGSTTSSQYLPMSKSNVVSKLVSPIKVDSLISLKQSDEMMRGIVPTRRFVQRPRPRLSGIKYPTYNYFNYKTNNRHQLSVDSNSNSQLQSTKLRVNNDIGSSYNGNRHSPSDSGDSVNSAGNGNAVQSLIQPPVSSSLPDVVTMKQPVAVTRVSSREEPMIVVTAPNYNFIANTSNYDSNNAIIDDELSSDRLFESRDKLLVDSTTKTPTVVNGIVVTKPLNTWIATSKADQNSNNKNYIGTNANKETSVGSFAQPSSNLNDLVKMEKFYNPKFYGAQRQTDLSDHFYGEDQEKMVPNSKAELIDFDHNEFDQIFNNVANNERAKQFQKSHLYPTTTTTATATTTTTANIDQQQNNLEPDNINNINIESDFNPALQVFERQRQQQQLAYDDWPTTTSGVASLDAATREADLVEQPVSSYSNGYNIKHNDDNNRHHHHAQHKQRQQLNYRDRDRDIDEDYPSTILSQQQQRKRSRFKRPHFKSKPHLLMAQNQNHAIHNRNKRLFYDYQSPSAANHLLGGVSLAYQPSVAQGSYADYYNGADGSPSYQVVHVHGKEKKSHGKYLWPIVGGGLTMLMGFLIISNILLSIPLLAIGASSLFNQGGHHSQQLVPVYNLSQLITTRPPSGRRRRRRRKRSLVNNGAQKHRMIMRQSNFGRWQDARDRRVGPKNDLEARIERFIDGIVKSSSVGASRLFSGLGFGWSRRQLLKSAYCHWPIRIRNQQQQQQFG